MFMTGWMKASAGFLTAFAALFAATFALFFAAGFAALPGVFFGAGSSFENAFFALFWSLRSFLRWRGLRGCSSLCRLLRSHALSSEQQGVYKYLGGELPPCSQSEDEAKFPSLEEEGPDALEVAADEERETPQSPDVRYF